MDYLRRFARQKGNSSKTEMLSVRVTKYLYDGFREHCDKYGLSMSEAVSLLIEHELGEDISGNKPLNQGNPSENNTYVKQEITSAAQELSSAIEKTDEVKQNEENSNTKRTQRKTTGKMFVTTEWKVEGALPCPICERWINSKNFARHIRKAHDRETTREVFTEFKEKADEMVRLRKEEIEGSE